MDDGGREHRPGHWLSAPPPTDLLAADAGALLRSPGDHRRRSLPHTRVADLGRAERSLTAIARALATHADIILLDEPTADLPAADCARLFGVLHELRDGGHAIIYVSHRLDEVYEVADTFAVLRDGKLISQGLLADHAAARLVQDIVGREPTSSGPAATVLPDDRVVLSLDGVRTENSGRSTSAGAGEVLGMVGLTGAGHMELGRALAGSRPFLKGRALLGGRPYFRVRSPQLSTSASVLWPATGWRRGAPPS